MKSLEKQLGLPGMEEPKKHTQKMTLMEKVAIGTVSTIASAILAGTIAIGIILYRPTPEPLPPPQGNYIFSYEEWVPIVKYNGDSDQPAINKARKIIENPELAYSLLPEDEQRKVDENLEETPSEFDKFLTTIFTGGFNNPETYYKHIYGIKDYETHRNDLSTRIIRHLHQKYAHEKSIRDENKP